MKKFFNPKFFNSQRAFTLIELLIVIAVLSILAVAIISAINPVKRINQAKDSNIQGDIAQIANAMQIYLTAKGTGGNAYYPSRVVDLTPGGTPPEEELKSEPKNCRGNNSYDINAKQQDGTTGCDTSTKNCARVAISCDLNDRPTGSDDVWCWSSTSGIASRLALGSCTP